MYMCIHIYIYIYIYIVFPRPYRTEVLARDRLVGVLAKRLREQHGDAVTSSMN